VSTSTVITQDDSGTAGANGLSSGISGNGIKVTLEQQIKELVA
jgi:hypothetical protein